MHIRKALALLAALALVANGCGDDSDDGDASDSGTGEDDAQVTTGPGVDDDEIRVAVLNDFSGDVASIGTPAAVGSEVYFEALNEEGGVCGRQVTVVTEDTEYDTQKAIQAYRAVKDDVAFITQLLGSATVLALSEQVANDNLTTLAGTLSSDVIPLDNIYVIQTPFALEAVNGISWAAEEVGSGDEPLKVGVIYQDDPYGEEGLAGVEYADSQLDEVEVVATASYSPGDEDLTPQVQEMESEEADVVWIHDLPPTTSRILGAAANRGYEPLWIGSSGSYGSFLAEPLGSEGLLDNFRVVNSNVSWGEDVPEMDRMLDAVSTHAPDQEPDNWLVTGWVSAKITHAALERACDMGDLSREGIAAAMDGLEVELGGMAPDLTYGSTPDERIPAREVRVNEIDPETTFPTPVTGYFASDAAQSWTLPAPQE